MFVFFGVVATVGSAYVHLERLSGLAFLASVAVGLLATALLVVDNLRDIPTDAASGKRTLAVRLGDRSTRRPVRGLRGRRLHGRAAGAAGAGTGATSGPATATGEGARLGSVLSALSTY